MKVTTPSATIGFRGTSGSGEVEAEGQTSIVLIRDPDGTIGEIVLVTPASIFSLSSVLQAATVNIDPTIPVVMLTMTPAEFQQQYGAVASSLPAVAADSQYLQNIVQPGEGPPPAPTPEPDPAPQPAPTGLSAVYTTVGQSYSGTQYDDTMSFFGQG